MAASAEMHNRHRRGPGRSAFARLRRLRLAPTTTEDSRVAHTRLSDPAM